MVLKEIDHLIKEGYISSRKHPSEDLYILNYTPKTQYEGLWNEYTEMCRGLIIDSGGNIKARCFQKFFNYEEVLSNVSLRLNEGTPFSVYEKMDGSLGILYWVRDEPFVATRGSFESEQAIVATKILKEKYSNLNLDKDLTYLFEIIYPSNRICVNYGEKEDLVFLAAFETHSGKEVFPEVSFPSAKKLDVDSDFISLKKMNLKNKEGFVVRFDDGFRFKIKFEDYVLLHSMIFSVSSRSIWNSLKEGKEFHLEGLPDEIFSWIENCKTELLDKYSNLEKESQEVYFKIKHLDRKSFATEALKYSFSSILFKMLDEKLYNDIIWKMIEPEYKTPRNAEV